MLAVVNAFAAGANAKAGEQVRRRAQHELPQHVRDVLELAREPVERIRIMGAEPRDRRLRPSLAGEEIAAVGRGQKILRTPLDDSQALLGEPQVPDHLRIEQAHGVGRDRILETRMEFLRDGGPADHLAALDHVHAQARRREIGRAGEAVMASADDDDVGFGHEGF
jgi:hypothetical protein